MWTGCLRPSARSCIRPNGKINEIEATAVVYSKVFIAEAYVRITKLVRWWVYQVPGTAVRILAYVSIKSSGTHLPWVQQCVRVLLAIRHKHHHCYHTAHSNHTLYSCASTSKYSRIDYQGVCLLLSILAITVYE